MKWVLVAVIFVLCMVLLFRDPHEAQLRQSRQDTQSALLIELVHVGTADASQLADDWRRAYPKPEDEQVTELRLVVEQVKADPAAAAKFTVRGKLKARAKLEEVVSFPAADLWGKTDPKPGL
nr:hypothetical protein [Stenotrophomonas pavanii]